MSQLAAGLFFITVMLGVSFLAKAMRADGSRASSGLRSLHDLLGTSALVLTIYAAIGRHTSTLAWEAMGLAGTALVLGVVMRTTYARLGSSRGMVLLIHAALGGSGAIILIATALG